MHSPHLITIAYGDGFGPDGSKLEEALAALKANPTGQPVEKAC